MRGATVALTGATGFVGTALIRRLLDAGVAPRCLVRTPEQAAGLKRLGCSTVVGDLSDRAALRALVDDVHTVVHGAGVVRGASAAAFGCTNISGTVRLLDALRTAATPRLLYVSSLAAREPQLSWYAGSKRRAEESIAQQAPPALRWCALRPPALYGPGDREMLPLWRSASRGWLPVPGRCAARISLLHVDDLAAAVALALEQEALFDGTRYELADERDGGYGWEDMAATAEHVWRRPVRVVPIPGQLLRAAALANLCVARLVGRAPMLTPGKARELLHRDWAANPVLFRERSGWAPALSLAEGLATLGLAGAERHAEGATEPLRG